MSDDWRGRALCKGRYDLMLNPVREDEAKALCAVCPVRVACGALGIRTRAPVGIWGGMTWEERLAWCPVCLGPKERQRLGCCPGHELLVLADFLLREQVGDEDYHLSRRTTANAKTNPDCSLVHGAPHGTWSAYSNRKCRCPEGLDQTLAARGTIPKTRRNRAIAW